MTDEERARIEAMLRDLEEKAAKEEKNEKDTEKLVKEATKKPEEWIKKVEKAREAIVCFSALLENKLDEAKKHLGAVEDDLREVLGVVVVVLRLLRARLHLRRDVLRRRAHGARGRREHARRGV